MLEIPEAASMAELLSKTINGKTVKNVMAGFSPHGFAFFSGDPKDYPQLLNGKIVEDAYAVGGQVEIKLQDMRLLFGDGANLRFYEKGEKMPPKHQLWVEFSDGSSLMVTVQMYGCIFAFKEGTNDNFYYRIAVEKPNPLSDGFTLEYFMNIWNEASPKLSVKAVLASEQRIPGLGNGTLQDILFNARLNPKTKLSSLNREDGERVYKILKQTLWAMSENGGRDTEKNLFGRPGGYQTILSSKTYQNPCPACGATIIRSAYMGGNVYFCPICQPLK